MYYNSNNISCGEDIVISFAYNFSTVFTNSSTLQSNFETCSANLPSIDFNSYTLIFSDVYNEMNNITCKSCPGLDQISSIFFIQCKFVLSTPLLLLFNCSLATSVFLERWKVSYITPLFKNGDINHVMNYRPVSIISIIYNILGNSL